MKKLPINNLEKAWVESSMVWLATHVGIEAFFKSDIILPSPSAGRPANLEILQEIQYAYREQLGSKLKPITLSRQPTTSRGTHYRYRDGVLVFSDRLLENDQDAIATLLHHVSHEWLDGNFQMDWSTEELDWFSDLLPVYMGWGIFGANTTVFSQSDRIGEVDNWRIASHRVLTSRLFGYGLALFAWGHGETAPRWQRMLRPDARLPFKKMSSYLHQTGDSYFQPKKRLHRPAENQRQLKIQLGSSSPSTLIATLWELQTGNAVDHDLIDPLTALLHHGDRHVRMEILNSLALAATLPDRTVEKVASLLSDSSEQVRASAAILIGKNQPVHDCDRHGIGHLLLDTRETVVMASAVAIATFAPQDDYLSRNLLKALRRALVKCNHDLAASIGRAFHSTHKDAAEKLEHFFEHDPDLKQQAHVMMTRKTDAR